jgi:hypothetical protein
MMITIKHQNVVSYINSYLRGMEGEEERRGGGRWEEEGEEGGGRREERGEERGLQTNRPKEEPGGERRGLRLVRTDIMGDNGVHELWIGNRSFGCV